VRKIILILVILAIFAPAPAPAFDGEVYMGRLFNSDYPAAPMGAVAAEYAAGMEVGHRLSVANVSVRPWAAIDVLMDDRSGGSFHPAGTRFSLGARVQKKSFFVEYEHMCWHPVDSGGPVYEYDMVKAGFRFGKD
jgi:hypothetical protein